MLGKKRGMVVKRSLLKVLFVLLVAGTVLCGRGLRAETGYTLATANTAGTYYPVGVALATLTKVKLEPVYSVSLTAVRSAGSAENLSMLREGQAQFAILQGLYGYWAWNGLGPFEEDGPRKDIRSISMLWNNVEHFVVKSDYVENGDMSDMKGLEGKRLSLGDRDSGSAGSGAYLLEELGYDPDDDFELVYLGYGSSSEAIRDGDIEVMNIPGGPPVEAVSRAKGALGKDLTILEFSDEQLEMVNRKHRLWSRYIIAENSYPGQDRRIQTIAQPNFLAVNSDVPEEDVYLIVKAMYRNLAFLHAIHPITKDMRISAAIHRLPVPLHPGAARFFREQGVEIPDRLIAK